MTRTWILILMTSVLGARMAGQTIPADDSLRMNEKGYYEMPGLNVMLFDDFYPEGHQGGLTIIQAGVRIAANGDVRLEPTPGQWSPVPVVRKRNSLPENGMISVRLSYPDSSKDRKGYNPIVYPDLRFAYTVRTQAIGKSIKLTVDLDTLLPTKWIGRVGFNLELFPGLYFGEHYLMDGISGIFPRQADGPMKRDEDGNLQPVPLASGKRLVVAPDELNKELIIESEGNDLQLYDGRGLYNNGWFVVRSTVRPGITTGTITWIITPRVERHWLSRPVIQVSQVGYHPMQAKFAVIELDKNTTTLEPIQLVRVNETGQSIVASDESPKPWGEFLRYKYLRYDFSNVRTRGLYKIRYGDVTSNEFEIKPDVFATHVWQPTLEYFLPEQMCHMRVMDRYKVWHGLCHMDDALMAPLNHNHFDGYYQHESTLTSFHSGDHIPGVNVGGWHDAGDYDLRVESQAETVYKLALAYELWGEDFDETTIDQAKRTVQILQPDGKPDILQQVEHGVLSLVGAYESMGRLYRGIICPTLQQYVHLGDGSTMTDNLVFGENATDPILHAPLPKDDRLLFTENNPSHELSTAQALAAASRVLRAYNPDLAKRCLAVSQSLYVTDSSARSPELLNAAAELYLTTSEPHYAAVLRNHQDMLASHPGEFAEVLGRVTTKLHDPAFTAKVRDGVKKMYASVRDAQKENPYGVPYKPYIWGAGWGIQAFGVTQLFLHLGFPDLFPAEYAFNALNFVLGCHPGDNTASFVSGVGVRSLTVAYGANRDEWSYIPGGIGSGTALIRPDFPELKTWPYFWQQTEYVMGGGTTDFLLLAIGADRLLNAETAKSR
ncbi:MAG: glycoside hydrolase family 9 protein [Bacteroidota bacterium]